MSGEQIVRDFFAKFWNQHNLNVADQLLTADHANHGAIEEQFPQGAEGFKVFASTFFAAFPDLHFDIQSLKDEGDTVKIEWVGVGTHQGDLMGMPATGIKATVHGKNHYRIANGKIAETWAEWNPQELMSQLGA